MKIAPLIRELSLVRSPAFDMLIFFVTGRCNSRCRHCFYWRNLGAIHEGLSLEAIETISRTMPVFSTLLLSGGEPTLRMDLPQIVEIFKRNNQIQSVSVPTNGLRFEAIATLARQISELDTGLLVTFNVSIDGFAEIHDHIRGVSGAYDLAMKTLHALRQVALEYDNFRILVNTVICAENYDQIIDFAEYIKSSGLVDGHFFEIVRGDPPEDGMKAVPSAQLKAIYQKLVPLQETYLVSMGRRRRRGLLRVWRRIADVGNLINRYQHQWGVYSQGAIWDFPCLAGEGIGVIDYNGQLRICELRDQYVDLSDYQYNFAQAWNSEVIRQECATARTHVCDCTHTCFIGLGARQNFHARFLKAPWLYLLYKMGKGW